MVNFTMPDLVSDMSDRDEVRQALAMLEAAGYRIVTPSPASPENAAAARASTP
jgi:hypothetical protein